MTELRSVDPRTLIQNPNNPRRTPAPPAMDEQLVASIKAVGIIQPPSVTQSEDGLMIVVGNRRVKAAISAGLASIEVIVCDADEAADAMRAVAENLIRASMSSIDIWRAIERLEAQGWNEQAIADALALPARTIRRLKLLAHLHPAMLDVMALGSMPNEEHLRTIAASTREEQAKAYGIVWEDDLFAPPGEDSRTTTNVEGFFGAQQEWLQNNLPERGTMLPADNYGRGKLPKGAEHVYGKPGKTDLIGHLIDARSGAVATITYRLPEAKKASKPVNGSKPGTAGDVENLPIPHARADVTQKGMAMIGDLRTDALHQALAQSPIEDDTLLGLLILALGSHNVAIDSGSDMPRSERQAICAALTEGDVLTADLNLLRDSARRMLAGVLSCRVNRSQSGTMARIAGETIGASHLLPNMATEEYLSCLSRGALETAAVANGVNVAPRAKDTRARLVTRFVDDVFVYPGARFELTAAELATVAEPEPPTALWTGAADGDEEQTAGNNNDADADLVHEAA